MERHPAQIRVASIPATHTYVRRLHAPGVVRLADPSGDDLRTPCFLDPDWLRRNADAFDLLHVHFGFEFYDPARLEAVADELGRLGKPLVYTAHDLRNPNHTSPDLHDAGLAVWMARADAIITLTQWAATRISIRYGRSATVLAHPHIVPLEELRRRQDRPRPRHADRARIGLHFKSLRANMAGSPALRGALDGIAARPGARLRIDLHCDVLDRDSDNHDRELVARSLEAAAAGAADLHVHNYFTDDELWDYFESVDAVVLPYRFGTHSGLLEAARDLGTGVIAPTCGAYGDQGATHLFGADDTGIDEASLAEAVAAAVDAGRPPPVPARTRESERREVAAAHQGVYRSLLAGARRGAA